MVLFRNFPRLQISFWVWRDNNCSTLCTEVIICFVVVVFITHTKPIIVCVCVLFWGLFGFVLFVRFVCFCVFLCALYFVLCLVFLVFYCVYLFGFGGFCPTRCDRKQNVLSASLNRKKSFLPPSFLSYAPTLFVFLACCQIRLSYQVHNYI